MHEQYRPASAPLRETSPPRPRSSVVAVVLGGLVVDLMGTLLLEALITLGFAVYLAANGRTPEGIAEAARLPAFVLSLQTMGALLSVLGGYVAARWARRRPLMHALGAGLLSMGIALPLTLLGTDPTPAATQVLLYTAHLPLVVVGGYLHAR